MSILYTVYNFVRKQFLRICIPVIIDNIWLSPLFCIRHKISYHSVSMTYRFASKRRNTYVSLRFRKIYCISQLTARRTYLNLISRYVSVSLSLVKYYIIIRISHITFSSKFVHFFGYNPLTLTPFFKYKSFAKISENVG